MSKRKSTIILLTIVTFFMMLTSTGRQANAATRGNNSVLTLNHNTYIYNARGKRIKGILKKGKKITSSLNLKRTNTVKRYYLLERQDLTNSNYLNKLFYLPYKTIKKNQYYKIGKNRYIKCINIGKVNGEDLWTSQASVVVDKKIKGLTYYAQDKTGKATSKKLVPGQKLIIDDFDFLGKQAYFSYHIKGTKYWVYSTYLAKTPRQTVSAHPTKSVINNVITTY